MQSDGHEEEIEMGKILDQFPALCKHMFADFGGVKPWEKRVSSLELVTIHIDKTEQAINELHKYVVGLS